METTRRDFLVGLFILISAGVMAGALVLTSRILERTIPIYMRLDSGAGISQDTRVLLQGLQVGRVTQVTPHVDSLALTVSFVAQLDIRTTFRDGTTLQLPVGTEAVIEQPPAALGQTEVRLILPARTPSRAILQPGDTIPSTRTRAILEALNEVMEQVRDEVAMTLEESRRALRASTEAVLDATELMAETRPAVMDVMGRISRNLEASEGLLADLKPRIDPMNDSIIATLGDTRELLLRAQAIADSTTSMMNDYRDPLGRSLAHLERTLEILEHFADQVSRRPTRLLTGVTPPDTTEGNR